MTRQYDIYAVFTLEEVLRALVIAHPERLKTVPKEGYVNVFMDHDAGTFSIRESREK